MHQLGPIVFRSGIVNDTGDYGKEILGQSHGGDGAADDRHNVDDGHFLRREGETGVDQFEAGLDEKREEEEEEYGAGSAKVEGEIGAAQDHIAVGSPAADAQGYERASQ